MKRLLILLILLIALTTGCGIYNLAYFILPDDIEFIEVVESLRSPQEISNYMINSFEYKAHVFTAQTPYELYLSKKGDCDEFSGFGVFIANYHGYETWQIQIFDNSFYSHMIAVYDEDIWLSITDNQYYFFGFDSFKEIVDFDCYIMNKIWTKYIVYNFDMQIIEEVNK